MSNTVIRSAFEGITKTWADANSTPISFENVPFEPPATGVYLRSFLIRGRTTAQDLERVNRRYIGIFQVNVVAPTNVGPRQAEAVAETIADLFPPATPIVKSGLTIIVLEPAQIAPALQGSTYTVPVSVYYRAESYPDT